MKVFWKKKEKGRLKAFHGLNYWKGRRDWLFFAFPDICIGYDEECFEISLSWLFWSLNYQSIIFK